MKIRVQISFISIFNIFSGFSIAILSYIHLYPTHIAARKTVIDDVTN